MEKTADYYVQKHDRIVRKLWERSGTYNRGDGRDPERLARLYKTSRNVYAALLKYVYPTLFGFKVREDQCPFT